MNSRIIACRRCGAVVDSDRIFCVKCRAALRNPASLLQPESPDDTEARTSVLKRAVIMILKGIGAAAALTFWFSRITTTLGLLLFGASIVVGLLCAAALAYLDDDFLKKHSKDGYWPSKPIDWGKPDNSDGPKTHENA